MAEEFKLKKSLVIQVLAIAFLLAPLGNLAGELFMGGQSSWYSPLSWFTLFSSLKGIDQLLLLAISASGAALLIQKKISWFGALVVLIWISIHNISYFISHDGPVWSIRLVPALFNLPVLVILYYFRFPYLDQRDHIVGGFKPRKSVSEDVHISDQLLTLSSISLSGCFFTGDFSGEMGEFYQVDLGDGLVVSIQLLYRYENGWGARFNDLTKGQKKALKKYISSKEEHKKEET